MLLPRRSSCNNNNNNNCRLYGCVYCGPARRRYARVDRRTDGRVTVGLWPTAGHDIRDRNASANVYRWSAYTPTRTHRRLLLDSSIFVVTLARPASRWSEFPDDIWFELRWTDPVRYTLSFGFDRCTPDVRWRTDRMPTKPCWWRRLAARPGTVSSLCTAGTSRSRQHPARRDDEWRGRVVVDSPPPSSSSNSTSSTTTEDLLEWSRLRPARSFVRSFIHNDESTTSVTSRSRLNIPPVTDCVTVQYARPPAEETETRPRRLAGLATRREEADMLVVLSTGSVRSTRDIGRQGKGWSLSFQFDPSIHPSMRRRHMADWRDERSTFRSRATIGGRKHDEGDIS